MQERSRQVTRPQRTRHDENERRVPFWLPMVNYYLLAFGIALAMFFLIRAVGPDGRGENSQTIAFVVGMTILGIAVVLREFILRNARRNLYRDQKRLDRSLAGFAHLKNDRTAEKITVEQNELIIGEIRKKSEAARVLSKLSAGHQEVVAMCSEYLAMNQRELQNVGVGSPRIAGFVRGREVISKIYRYHMLKWAELETQEFTQIAAGRVKIEDKLEQVQKALTVVDTALDAFPVETNLLESKRALIAAGDSLRVSGHLEFAEKATQAGEHTIAIDQYEQALALMERLGGDQSMSAMAEKIIKELEKAKALALINE